MNKIHFKRLLRMLEHKLCVYMVCASTRINIDIMNERSEINELMNYSNVNSVPVINIEYVLMHLCYHVELCFDGYLTKLHTDKSTNCQLCFPLSIILIHYTLTNWYDIFNRRNNFQHLI